MKIKQTVLALSMALSLGLLASCANTSADSGTADNSTTSNTELSSVEQIKANDKLRIGVFSDKPPFGSVNANGEYEGFDIYIANKFGEDLLGDASKVEFIPVEAANRVAYLESDKVDIILANFTVTDERKQAVDFANPYMQVALGVTSADDNLITDVSQLNGKKLIVNKGTTADTYFTENHPEIELLKFDHNSEAFQALKDGRGDAMAHDNTLLFAWTVENPGFTTAIESIGDQETIAPAVQKGNEDLLNWINDELVALGKVNFIHEAYDATLAPIYGDSVDPESVVIESK